LIGTRLGIDKINQVYQQALIATLQMPQSIGIAGYVLYVGAARWL
jgi:cysteine protease ATG4